jgi:methylenetetrahydrofolate dehydrogenase (NADP+)/methenyltetrahydrofolate cyclohydrolase
VATLIDGRAIAARIEKETQREILGLARMGARPSLVAVQVGEDSASELYLRRQERACARLGIPFRRLGLAAETSERQLLREISELNRDPGVTGIMLQMPLPPPINLRTARRALSPEKDVEGVHPQNLGWLLSGRPILIPCTAAAGIECLTETGAPLEGLEAVVVGHSETVGKPVALLLMERLCTVTVCHHGTRDLRAHTRRADVLVVAVGRPGLIDGDAVKEQSIVIDVGINEVERGGRTEVVGDVDAATVAPKAAWLTPVPGGVGPVTVAMLLRNTLRSLARQGPLPF